MLKYIVTYIIVKMNIGLLDLPAPKYDQFGRDTVNYQPFMYEVVRIDRDTIRQEFSDRKAAFAFYNLGLTTAEKEKKARGDSSWSYWLDFGRLENFKIDSLKSK